MSTLALPLPAWAGTRRHDQVLDVMLALFVVLIPCQFEVVVDLRLAPSDLFLLLAVLLGGMSLRYASAAWSPWHVAIPAMVLAGALVGAADRGELSRYVLVNKCIGMGVLLLFYMLITTVVQDWQDIRWILRLLVISVTVQNIVAMLAFLAGRAFGIEVPWLNGNPYRLCGMLVDANGYGGLLVLTLTLSEVASSSARPLFSRAFTNFSSLTLLLGIVLTFSRSTWLAMAVTWMAMTIVRRTAALRLAAWAGAALLFVPLLGSGALTYARNMASRPNQVLQRLDIISTAGGYIEQHPLLGLGLGGFLDREQVIVHNTALWFLTEFGLFGLLILTGFLGWFFLRGVTAWRCAPLAEKPIIAALLLAHLSVCALSLGIEAFYLRPWWLVFGLIGSACHLCATSRTPKEEQLWQPTELRN